MDEVKPDRWKFACICGAEAKEHVREGVDLAISRLGKYTFRENLVDRVVSELNWVYGARITGIDNDQWSAVSAETYPNDEESYTDGPFKTYIQCDRVEDGFAYTLNAFYDHYGDSRQRVPEEEENR